VQWLSDILSFLAGKLPWFLAMVAGVILYELLKKAATQAVRAVATRTQDNWALLLVAGLLGAVAVYLWLR